MSMGLLPDQHKTQCVSFCKPKIKINFELEGKLAADGNTFLPGFMAFSVYKQ